MPEVKPESISIRIPDVKITGRTRTGTGVPIEIDGLGEEKFVHIEVVSAILATELLEGKGMGRYEEGVRREDTSGPSSSQIPGTAPHNRDIRRYDAELED